MRTWIGTGDQGSLVEGAAATVSAFDHGFTVGDGIFETMKSTEGRLFLWPWHLERLHESARRMRIRIPDDELLTGVVRTLAEEAGAEITGAARIRLTISAGLGPLGSNREAVPPTVTCAASPIPPRSGPARVHMASWPRNERSPLAGVKSTSYAENVLALAEAAAVGAGEAIFANTAGRLCEGTGSNVFIVVGDAVFTPPTGEGLLAGVTRRFVLGLGDHSIDITERQLSIDEFFDADELFVTSTFQDIRGVESIDGDARAVGRITEALQQRFSDAAAAEWCWS